MKRGLAAVLALAVSACSLAFMRTVPDGWDERTPPRCSTAPWAFVDGAATSASLLSFYLLYTYDSDAIDTERETGLPDVAPLALVPALLYGVSTFYGVMARRECKDDQARFRRQRALMAE